MKELKRVTDVFKVDTEAAAAQLIQEYKDAAGAEGYDLTKYESKYRNKKKKGEIEEEWYIVTLQKDFAIEE